MPQGNVPCGDEGSVLYSTVLEILVRSGVSVHKDGDHTIIVVNEIPTSIILGEMVPRRMVHYISRKTEIPIEHFYHPDMVNPVE